MKEVSEKHPPSPKASADVHRSLPSSKTSVGEGGQIKTFGIGLSIILAVLALRIFLKRHFVIYNYLIIITPIVLCLAIFKPLFLKPLYKIFSGIGFCIGWFINRTILILIFYLVFAPVGLVLRLIKKDLLDRKIEPQRNSYWFKKEHIEFDKSRYEKQY